MSQAAHYRDTPGNRPEDGALVQYQAFEHELEERSQSIASMLPSTLSAERFKNTVIAAVRQDPSILAATLRSVMSAVTHAAQDGLVPDGREGHISVYNVNAAKKGERDRWEKQAQWNPMAHGLRKRMRELDGIIANAEVVHENDVFVWHQGDDPRIVHEPAKLGTKRGEMIGAYCIYKREDGTILHREVMDMEQIEATRAQSKAANSLMWTKFKSEGYRKSVLRRGIKTVPVCDKMREIIHRDDVENFDFTPKLVEHETLAPPSPPAPPPAPAIEHKPALTADQLLHAAPDAEPVELSEAEQRALDRQSMREMRHESPEPDEYVDPETGEIFEEAPGPVETSRGTEWVPWGAALIGKFKATPTLEAVTAELQRNYAHMERCEKEAPKAYSSIVKAYQARVRELKGTAQAA